LVSHVNLLIMIRSSRSWHRSEPKLARVSGQIR